MKVQNEQSKFDTDEHILVCLSSSPSNARIIHTAAKMAKTLHARFTAIYVQTDTVINDEDQSRLRSLITRKILNFVHIFYNFVYFLSRFV